MINGTVNFTSVSGPDTGRTGNQGTIHIVDWYGRSSSITGFENLSLDESTDTLWVMLQSATNQDGGDNDATSRYTRLFAYDVSAALIKRPTLKAEYVVPLPLNSKGTKIFAASDIHFVSKGVLLVLSRDGNGHGDDNTLSKYK